MLTTGPSALKRTKTYESFEDVRPTVRNKPSGLVNTWYDITTTPSPYQTTAPQIHGHPSNSFAFYTPPQSYPDQSSSFPSLLSTPQLQPTPMQPTESFFPVGPYMSMDVSTMGASPSTSDPSLSAPHTELDDPFWSLPATGPPHVHWKSAVSEMKPVTISFSFLLSRLFSTRHHRSFAYPVLTWVRMGSNVPLGSKISRKPSVMTSTMTSFEESSSLYSQAVPHG